MTPEHREAKRRIQDAVRVWKHLVPLDVTVTHVFVEGPVDTSDHDALAQTDAAWEYHQARIHWSLRNAAGAEQEYLEGAVVHELVHVMLSAIEDEVRTDEGDHSAYLNKVCEHTVETIAAAIIRVAR